MGDVDDPGTGGGQAGGGEPVAVPAQGEQTWVVQRKSEDAWFDVATVTVPSRTKRKTIVEKALEQAPMFAPEKDDPEMVPFRVLDADSTTEIPVRWEVPPAPEAVLKIG